MRSNKVYLSSLYGVLTLLVLALVLQLVLAQTLFAAKVKVGTALRTQAVFTTPMLAIEENGLWKKLGVDAEWVPFKGGSAMHRAAAAGAIQIGITDVTGTVRSVSRGLPVTMIYHLGPVTDFGIWVLTDSPIKKPKDLAGKSIDVTRMGGTAHAYGQLVAKVEGIRVKFVGVGSSRAGIAALLSKAIDGVVKTPFVTAPLAVKGRVRLVLSLRDYLPKQWMGRVLYVTNDFLKQDPDSVGKVVKAINMATRFAMNNKAWTIGKMKSFSRYSPEAAELLFPRLKYSKDGRIDKGALANVRNFLIKSKLITEAQTPPVEKLYTDRFTR